MIDELVALETTYMLVFPNGKYFARNGYKTRFEAYAQRFQKLKDAAKEIESRHESLGLRCIQKMFFVLPDFDTEVLEEWRMPEAEERIVYVIGSDRERPFFVRPQEDWNTNGTSNRVVNALFLSLSEAEELRKESGGKIYKTIIFEKEVPTS